jgi:lipopolysaccharide transport system ATP-binding protein
MTSRLLHGGERVWTPADVPQAAAPFRPLVLRLRDGLDRPVDHIGWGQPFTVEFEYELAQEITGLRVGLYLYTSRGEQILTSFDTDQAEAYEARLSRPAGRYRSQCRFPAGWLNEGTFVLGVNASSFRIRSYFTDESALMFGVDGVGAPGSQWQEPRGGSLRPALDWQILEAAR